MYARHDVLREAAHFGFEGLELEHEGFYAGAVEVRSFAGAEPAEPSALPQSSNKYPSKISGHLFCSTHHIHDRRPSAEGYDESDGQSDITEPDDRDMLLYFVDLLQVTPPLASFLKSRPRRAARRWRAGPVP